MRLYGVAEASVHAALTAPDQITTGELNAWHAWKREGGGGWLRVTFRDELARRVVITVTPKKKFPGDAHEN